MGRVLRGSRRLARLWARPAGSLGVSAARAGQARSYLAAAVLLLIGRSLSGCDRGRDKGVRGILGRLAGIEILHDTCRMSVVFSRSVVESHFSAVPVRRHIAEFALDALLSSIVCCLCAAGGVLTEMCCPDVGGVSMSVPAGPRGPVFNRNRNQPGRREGHLHLC